jgi:hypothetical protein
MADATPPRRISLAKCFARYCKIYDTATTKRDLYRWLAAGKVSCWGERRPGPGLLVPLDCRIWGRGDATDALLGVSWADSRVIRGPAPQRLIVRPGGTVYRPNPRPYEFVRLELALDELIALMPEDVRPRMEARHGILDFLPWAKSEPPAASSASLKGGLSGFFSKLKPSAAPRKTKVEIAAEWVLETYPEYTLETFPREIPASKVIARIKEIGGPDVTETTFQRAVGRR